MSIGYLFLRPQYLMAHCVAGDYLLFSKATSKVYTDYGVLTPEVQIKAAYVLLYSCHLRSTPIYL